MVKPSLSNPPLHKEISSVKQSSLRGHSRGPWRQCNTNILCDNWICHVNENSAIAEQIILAKDPLVSGRGPFRLKLSQSYILLQ